VALIGQAGGGPTRATRGWAFIDLAALGTNSAWNYAFTLLRVILLPIAFIALAFVAIFFAAARHLLSADTAPVAVLVVAFASVIVAGVTLAWCVVRTHRRPWLSLVSRDLTLDWRRLAIGAGVEGGLLLALLGLSHAVTGQPELAGPGMGLPALALIILLVPFQAASEEMIFRGYLTQALGRIVRSRVLIAAVVGVIFAALHFDAYGALTIPYLCGLSLIYSVVSLRDERLELTIGAHAATNWFGVSAADALDIGKGSAQLSLAAVAVLLVNGALFYGLTRLLVHRFCDRQSGRR
jgi:membrane protease YdiL (CAAX protease family)